MADLSVLKQKIAQEKCIEYSEGSIRKMSGKLRDSLKKTIYTTQELDAYIELSLKLLCASKGLYTLVNTGCFDYEKNNAAAISCFAKILLLLKMELSLTPIDIQYLQNIEKIRELYNLKSKHTLRLKHLIKEMTKICKFGTQQCSCLLTICARVEHMAVCSLHSTEPYQTFFHPTEDLNCLNSFSIEEVIDAMGFITSIVSDIYGNFSYPQIIFPDLVFSKRVEKILLIACQICFLQELILMNNILGYQCEKRGEKIFFSSTAINQQRMQDYRLGYIKYALALNNFKMNMAPSNMVSYADLMKDIDKIIELEEVLFPHRYRLKFPALLLQKLCNIDELTQEEYESIEFESGELNYIFDNIKDTKIYKSLSMLNYIQLRRIFIFFYFAQVQTLFNKYQAGLISKEVYTNSLIPHFKADSFNVLFDIFGEKIQEFLELNNFESTNNRIIDLMYQPLISNNTSFCALCTIAFFSNIGRNVCVLLKRIASSINEDGTTDALIDALDFSFDSIGISHKSNISLGKITDIDFAFLIENTVYLAECKKVYHPTSMSETRATIDAIHKAERQLSKVITALQKPQIKAQFLKQAFPQISPEKIKFIPLIITSNRILSNTNEFAFPIRHFKEVISFVSNGTICIGKENISIWKGNTLTEADMLHYLSPQSEYRDIFTHSTVLFQRKLKIGNTELIVDDYGVNMLTLNDYCMNRWGVHAIENI